MEGVVSWGSSLVNVPIFHNQSALLTRVRLRKSPGAYGRALFSYRPSRPGVIPRIAGERPEPWGNYNESWPLQTPKYRYLENTCSEQTASEPGRMPRSSARRSPRRLVLRSSTFNASNLVTLLLILSGELSFSLFVLLFILLFTIIRIIIIVRIIIIGRIIIIRIINFSSF